MKLKSNLTDLPDMELVTLALSGERDALQQLTLRHYSFVHNVAWKMAFNPADADDLTQEVFVKVITRLAQFEGRSEFRTWLYRIAVNHFLNAKKRPMELLFGTFSDYFQVLDDMPDHDPSEQEQADWSDSFEEVKISCTAGMLMCLDREQRITYILGEVFKINHRTAAEVLEISPDNYRQRLTRARADLHSWMLKKCGLVNPAAPCRCPKKTRAFMEAGYVDPENLLFNAHYTRRIREAVEDECEESFDLIDKIAGEVFESHPYREQPGAAQVVEAVLNNDEVRRLFRI
ncbi:MAG: sigma-70 family RNA polymerase sigma factor [Bacteroidetes bacterium]|nr:sigma-70 family RNA polymerase sigma factor [Bacteroidota bacterium]